MPSLYCLKKYHPQSHYHVYNRGARQEVVFHNKQDFQVFRKIIRQEEMKRFPDIQLKAFCLMPNHYHMLIYQEKEREIVGYMRSIGMRYSHYYRRKYYHRGRLFESSYRAIHLLKAKDVGRIRNYILANPIKAGLSRWSYVSQERL